MKAHEIAIFENSNTVKKQDKAFSKQVGKMRYVCNLRWDDRCGNGHNSFAITGDVYNVGRHESGGCVHDMIAKQFPEFSHMIKWHLVNSIAPMYYFENSQYHAKNGDLDAARCCAVWDDASIDDILDDQKMLDRLPELMAQFKHDIEQLGFIW